MWADSNVSSALKRPVACEQLRRAAWKTAADAHNFAVDDVEFVGAGLHQLRRMAKRLVAQFGGARRVASPHMTVTREAKAPMPLSMRSVWPWMTRMLAYRRRARRRRFAPRRFRRPGDRGDAGDDVDATIGFDLDAHGVERPEPTLLDEHGHTARLFARRGAQPIEFADFSSRRRQCLSSSPA